jgi:hypothetical protein
MVTEGPAHALHGRRVEREVLDRLQPGPEERFLESRLADLSEGAGHPGH